MGPGRVLWGEVSEQQHSTEVVDGGDQDPFLFGEGGPQMQ